MKADHLAGSCSCATLSHSGGEREPAPFEAVRITVAVPWAALAVPLTPEQWRALGSPAHGAVVIVETHGDVIRGQVEIADRIKVRVPFALLAAQVTVRLPAPGRTR